MDQREIIAVRSPGLLKSESFLAVLIFCFDY